MVAGGGYTLMSEAVYLHKPLLSVPVEGQFEQVLNALYLEQLGYGVYAKALDGPTLCGLPREGARLRQKALDGLLAGRQREDARRARRPARARLPAQGQLVRSDERLMLALLTLALLTGGPSTVSLKLPEALACPRAGALADRLGRVGLVVVKSGAALEVELVETPDGLELKATRTLDSEKFDRVMSAKGEACDTLERLVVVLIHSWARSRLPLLAPHPGAARAHTAPDAGP